MDEIIKQLKNLNQVKPKEEWKAANREQLLTQINAQQDFSNADKKFGVKNLDVFLPTNWGRVILKPKPIGVLLVILLVLSGGYFSVNASYGSVPGDVLYTIKITSEKIKLTFTTDDRHETELHIEFAQKRLEELEKITQNQEPETEKKNKNAKKAITAFKKEMDKVNENLEKVKVKQPAEETVQVAKLVTEKTDEFTEKLKDMDPEIKQDIKEAIVASEETSDKAIDVIIEKHESGEVDAQDEVKETIENKLNKTKEKINELENQIKEDENTAENQELQETENQEVIQDNSEEETTETNDQEAEQQTSEQDQEVKVEPEDAKKNLEEAEELLENGSLSDAFEKVKQSKQIVKQVEDDLDKTDEQTEIAFEENQTEIENDEQQPIEETEQTQEQTTEPAKEEQQTDVEISDEEPQKSDTEEPEN